MNLHYMALHRRIGCLRSRALVVGIVVLSAASGLLADTHTWSASAPGNASVAGNWTPNGPFVAGDTALFNAGNVNCTWDIAGVTLGCWNQTSGYTGAVTCTTTYSGTFDTLRVTGDMNINGGRLTHRGNGATEIYRLCVKVGGNLTVGAGGSIDVSARGYTSNSGPGNDGQGHPASHGGQGNQGVATYGSFSAPVTLGSGHNGSGGGAVALKVSGSTTVTGSILANGDSSNTDPPAGGSVLITTATISGAGTISANGGNTIWSGQCFGTSGGGRVAVYLTQGGASFSGLTVTPQAFGGNNSGDNSACLGAAGTVYLDSTDNSSLDGRLIIDNNDRHSKTWITTEIPSGQTWTPGALYLANAGVLGVKTGTTLNLSSTAITSDADARNDGIRYNGGTLTPPSTLTISNWTLIADAALNLTTNLVVGSNGGITHSGNVSAETYKMDLTVNGNLTVNSGGIVDVTGRGYSGSNGTGFSVGDAAGGHGCGGTYGGKGGVINEGDTSGATYGSPTAPVNCGSPGSGGVAGGGAIKLTVSGTTTVSAAGDSIKADGARENSSGSGGSIYIITSSITGAGVIQANGGAAAGVWNTGGGGRVAILLTGGGGFSSLSYTPTAYGGNSGGNPNGAAGTVYLDSTNNSTNDGRLIIDNTNRATPYSGIVTAIPASGAWTTGSVMVKNTGKLTIPSGTSLATNGTGTTITINGANNILTNAGTLTIGGTGIANSGTFDASAAGALTTYLGQANDAAVSVAGGAYGKLVFNNAGTTFNLPAAATTVTDSLKLSGGTLSQSTGNLSAGTFYLPSGTVWSNASTGDVVVGAGGVVNNGEIDFDGGGGGCGGADGITITSSSPGTQRAWIGSGACNVADVAVTDQGGTLPITALSSASVSGNGANWSFLAACEGVAINDRNGHTNDIHPPLTLASIFSGGGMRIAQYISLPTDTSSATWKAFAASDSIALNAGAGRKYVWAQFASAANGTGSKSSWYVDSTIYDNVAPTSVVTTSGTYTPATWPDTIRGTASDALSGIDSVQIKIKRTSDGYCWNGTAFVSGSQWVKATGTTAWTYYIDGPVMGIGIDSIYARPYDGAGNAGLAGGRVTMDNRQPHATVVTIVDSSGYTSSDRVHVSITAIDADSVMMGTDSVSGLKKWIAYSSPDTLDTTFSPGDGVKSVWVRLKNANGNIGPWLTDTTILDRNLPSSVTISNLTLQSYRATTWPGSINGTATDSLSGVGAVRVRVKRGANHYWNGAIWVTDPTDSTLEWATATGTTSWQLTLASGNLTDTSYSVTVRAYDRAGNPASASQAFSYDNTAPVSEVSTSGTFNPATWPDTVRGTAFDAISGVDSVWLSVRRDTVGRFWDGSGGWGADTVWLTPAGLAAWRLPLTDGNLANGGYTVLVRAIDKAGNRQAVADTGAFNFYTPPSVRFAAAPTSALKGDTVHFSDSSTGVVSSWLWRFGDGSTSALRSPTHAYADTGSYTVTLRATGAGGTDSLVRASYIRVFGDGQNPVKISGRYLSDTLVALRYEYLDRVKGSGLNLPDELRLWRRVNQMPADSQKGSDVQVWQVKLSAIPHVGGVFVDTVTVPALSAPDSAYGFVTQITWLLSASTPFAAYNAAYVLMRDTTRPANELLLSGTYLSGDSARITIDSAQTIDTTIADSVLVWYGLTNAPDFSSAASTQRLDASAVIAGSTAGRYRFVIRQSAFDGVTQPLYARLIQKGHSGLLSTDTTKTVFNVGRPRPGNDVALAARALTSSEIELSWTFPSGGCDSIRIWYGTTAVPQKQVTFSTTGLTSLMYPTVVSKDTVVGLSAQTQYFFGLQICRDRQWSVVEQNSSADATTNAAGNDVIPNTIDIDSIVFDTDSNYITIEWHVQLSRQYLTDYAVRYGVGRFDTDPPARWDPATDTVNRTILRLPEGVVFDTLYCIRMWAKSHYGQPSDPTPASTGTVRSPAYTWQVLTNVDFQQGDTARAFNGNIAVVNGGAGTVPSNTVRVFTPADSLLAGFVVVSVGFVFDNPQPAPPFTVALRYVFGSIPAGYSAQDVRIYRLTPDGVWLVQRSTILDVNARRVSIRLDASTGDNLDYPFIAMVDTSAPRVTFSEGTDTASVVGLNGVSSAISDTISIADNAGNVRWYLWYGKGDHNVFSGAAQSSSELSAAVSRVITAVPTAGAENNGIRSILVIEDGVHSDTIDLSRRAWRRAFDDAVPKELQWYPLHSTVQLDSVNASTILSSTVSDPSTWQYDNRYTRLFRFVSYEGNAAADNNDKWAEYSVAPDSLFTFAPGALMWIKRKEAGLISYGSGITLSLKDTFEMRLPPHAWTDLALPFGFSMKLGDILAATGNGADTVLDFYSWDNTSTSGGTYVTLPLYIRDMTGNDTTTMLSTLGGGYAVWNPTSHAVVLRFPATPAVASLLSKVRAAKTVAASDDGFLLRVELSVDGIGRLSPVLCGYRPGAEVPTFYQSSPSFSAVRAGVWDGTGMRGHAMLHKATDGGYAFGLLFTNPDDGRHRMSYTALPQTALPKGMSALLFNPMSGEYESPTPNGSYAATVESQSVAYRYLVVGDADYRTRFKAQFPVYKLALSTVYPNPMGRRLTIRFTVPYAGVHDVRFELFDLKGRVLWQKRIDGMLRPGRHSLVWDCTSTTGSELAAGSYVLRMMAREDGKKGIRSFKQRLTKIGR